MKKRRMIHKIWAIAVARNQEAADVAVFFPFRGRLREEDDVPRRGRGLEPASARVSGVEW